MRNLCRIIFAAVVGAFFIMACELHVAHAELLLTSQALTRFATGQDGISKTNMASSSDIQDSRTRGQSCLAFPNVPPTVFTSDTPINFEYQKLGELTQSLNESYCSITFADINNVAVALHTAIPGCMNNGSSGRFSIRPPFAVFAANMTLYASVRLCRRNSNGGIQMQCEYYDVCQSVSLEPGVFQFRLNSFLHDYVHYYEEANRRKLFRRFGDRYNPFDGLPMNQQQAQMRAMSSNDQLRIRKMAYLLNNTAPIMSNLPTASERLLCPVDHKDQFACSHDGFTLLQCINSDWLMVSLPIGALCQVSVNGVMVVSNGQSKSASDMLALGGLLAGHYNNSIIQCSSSPYACSGDGSTLLRCADGVWKQVHMPENSWCEFAASRMLVLDAARIVVSGYMSNPGAVLDLVDVNEFANSLGPALQYSPSNNQSQGSMGCQSEQVGSLACSGDGRTVFKCNAANMMWMTLELPPGLNCTEYNRTSINNEINNMIVAPISTQVGQVVTAVSGYPSVSIPQLPAPSWPVNAPSGCHAQNLGMFACSEDGRVLFMCGSKFKWEMVSMLPNQLCRLVRSSVALL